MNWSRLAKELTQDDQKCFPQPHEQNSVIPCVAPNANASVLEKKLEKTIATMRNAKHTNKQGLIRVLCGSLSRLAELQGREILCAWYAKRGYVRTMATAAFFEHATDDSFSSIHLDNHNGALPHSFDVVPVSDRVLNYEDVPEELSSLFKTVYVVMEATNCVGYYMSITSRDDKGKCYSLCNPMFIGILIQLFMKKLTSDSTYQRFPSLAVAKKEEEEEQNKK